MSALLGIACSSSGDDGPPRGGAGAAGASGASGANLGGGGAGEVAEPGGASGAGGDGGTPCSATPTTTLHLESSAEIGPRGGSYDGPGVIERSTEESLLVYFEAGSGEDAVVYRASIKSNLALPVFPPGARVWVSKTPAGLSDGPVYRKEAPSQFELRDAEGGRLILAMSYDSTISPLVVSRAADVCAQQHPSCSGSLVQQSLEIQSDAAVTIANGHDAHVQIDGADYLVGVQAQKDVAVDECAADYIERTDGTYKLSLIAEDAQSLVDALKVGEPPTCAHGNDASASFEFAKTESADYEGVVAYQGIDAEAQGAARFTADGSSATFLFLSFTPDLFTTPAVGTELWFRWRGYSFGALSDGEDGPLLVAQARLNPSGADADVQTALEDAAGVAITLQERCDYGASASNSAEVALSDVLFATDPPTLAKSGERTPLVLNGEDYEAWVDGRGTVSVAIYRP